MTEVGHVYGQSLYELARDEHVSEEIRNQLEALTQSFRQEPEFLTLLSTPSLPKAERCRILDECFRGSAHPYMLNFLKILTEKGYIRHFSDCCEAYTASYNADNGILPVTAVTAVALSEKQAETLTKKLNTITGKQVQLRRKIDPTVLGGIRLDYDDQRLDDTVSHRMEKLRDLLSSTVL